MIRNISQSEREGKRGRERERGKGRGVEGEGEGGRERERRRGRKWEEMGRVILCTCIYACLSYLISASFSRLFCCSNCLS